jgi:hypothetical protein
MIIKFRVSELTWIRAAAAAASPGTPTWTRDLKPSGSLRLRRRVTQAGNLKKPRTSTSSSFQVNVSLQDYSESSWLPGNGPSQARARIRVLRPISDRERRRPGPHAASGPAARVPGHVSDSAATGTVWQPEWPGLRAKPPT